MRGYREGSRQEGHRQEGSRPKGLSHPCPANDASIASDSTDPAIRDKGDLVADAELGGTVPMGEWIGDEAANTFSY